VPACSKVNRRDSGEDGQGGAGQASGGDVPKGKAPLSTTACRSDQAGPRYRAGYRDEGSDKVVRGLFRGSQAHPLAQRHRLRLKPGTSLTGGNVNVEGWPGARQPFTVETRRDGLLRFGAT
jgi:hypothetical protein